MKQFLIGYSEREIELGKDIPYDQLTYQKYLLKNRGVTEIFLVEGQSIEDVISLVTIRTKMRYKGLKLSESNQMRLSLMDVSGDDNGVNKYDYKRDKVREDLNFIVNMNLDYKPSAIYKTHLIAVNEEDKNNHRMIILTFHRK